MGPWSNIKERGDIKRMEKLPIGVIGTGHMGRNHVRNLSEEDRFDLVGIYDTDLAQAEKIALLYGTSAFAALEDLLDQAKAVVIAVPSSIHKEIGLIVAAHNVHALIEKPLATNSKDAQEIVDAFRQEASSWRSDILSDSIRSYRSWTSSSITSGFSMWRFIGTAHSAGAAV